MYLYNLRLHLILIAKRFFREVPCLYVLGFHKSTILRRTLKVPLTTHTANNRGKVHMTLYITRYRLQYTT